MSFAVGKNSGIPSAQRHGSAAGHAAGNLTGKNSQNSSEPLPPLTSRQALKESQAIVLQFPIKVAAELQQATTRAVESQRDGESAMSFRAAVNMARANPRARALIGRLLGFTGQYSDPDFMEGLEQVVGYMLRQKQQAEDGPGAACDEANLDLFGPVRGNA
jgi:hypothetical protein